MWVKNGKGLVLWLCGLAGSGKSTIGRALYEAIKQEIPNVVYLDGDELRDLLGHFAYDRLPSRLIDTFDNAKAVEIRGGWCEIDFKSDLEI